jgi:hypothetical protein
VLALVLVVLSLVPLVAHTVYTILPRIVNYTQRVEEKLGVKR